MLAPQSTAFRKNLHKPRREWQICFYWLSGKKSCMRVLLCNRLRGKSITLTKIAHVFATHLLPNWNIIIQNTVLGNASQVFDVVGSTDQGAEPLLYLKYSRHVTWIILLRFSAKFKDPSNTTTAIHSICLGFVFSLLWDSHLTLRGQSIQDSKTQESLPFLGQLKLPPSSIRKGWWIFAQGKSTIWWGWTHQYTYFAINTGRKPTQI